MNNDIPTNPSFDLNIILEKFDNQTIIMKAGCSTVEQSIKVKNATHFKDDFYLLDLDVGFDENNKIIVNSCNTKIGSFFFNYYQELQDNYLVLSRIDGSIHTPDKAILSLESLISTEFINSVYPSANFHKIKDGYYLVSYQATFPLLSIGQNRFKFVCLNNLKHSIEVDSHRKLTDNYYLLSFTACCEDCGTNYYIFDLDKFISVRLECNNRKTLESDYGFLFENQINLGSIEKLFIKT
ncbi:MAG: hypothetical protein WC011_02775 [Candidatus Paceibacterota bacterium]